MSATVAPMPERGRARVVSVLYLAATMVFFGSAFPSSKVVVEQVPHSLAAALRFGIGAAVLVLLVLLRLARARRVTGAEPTRPGARRLLVRAAAAGLLGVFAYNVLFFWGLSLAPAADGAVLVPVLSPVFTAAAFVLAGRERPAPARVAGLLVGAGGAALFFAGIEATAGSARLLGDLLFVAGAACWAGYTVVSKRVLAGLDALLATTCATVAGAVALAVVALPAAVQVHWSAIPAVAWVNLVYLGVGPTAVAYLMYSIALRSLSPTTATLAMFAVPLFGVAGSAAFLGESFTHLQILGAAVLLAGAVVAVSARGRREEPGT
ncbi:DMT family transporter [Geodermatophilus sp. DSM 44513]|uniref:DMT family transporter n=1 Tax=Geodermatophilus sp. DSM 44513 TaxID=1528104 RepID=UPI0012896EFD|nr:DMT family transporter [Geodermatophilus sp. DSM 44513]WNV75165.1 DMT family transporter [Geodermatophilus sp. DSM 44513]